jgi:DNA mismatch endonuclease (patch repair protein)
VDRVSREKRSKIMAAIRSKDTKPEMKLRKGLWANGLRFRVNYSHEKIDVAFPSKKVAIFVDGCFWHSCPVHAHLPKSNQMYWKPKLQTNINRDHAKNKRLEEEGWRVLRFWEHELANTTEVVEKIKCELIK